MSGNSVSNSAIKVRTALLLCAYSSDVCGLAVLQKKLLPTAVNPESGRMSLWLFNYNDSRYSPQENHANVKVKEANVCI